MDRYIAILLPIAWAIIATIIALILYRTSDALFEQSFPGEGERRRVKLVGSIAIAAVVFLGLARFTDLSPFTEMTAREQRVSTSALNDHRRAITGLRREYEELRGCMAIAPARECLNSADKIGLEIDRVERGLDEVDPPQL